MSERKKRFLLYLFYVVSILCIGAGVAVIYPVYRQCEEMEAILEESNAYAAIKRSELTKLHCQVRDLESNPAAIEKVAREKFGLCRPGETILVYPGN